MPGMPFALWQQEMAKFPDLQSAEDWRVRSRIEVEGLPNPWENASAPPPISRSPQPQGELPPINAGPNPMQSAMPMPPMQNPQRPQSSPVPMNDIWGMWTQAYKQSEDLDRQEAALRRQQFERGQQMLQQQQFGPTRAEKLFALSAALLSPTQVPGFKGALMNVAPVMSQLSLSSRRAGSERQRALAELQGNYETDEIKGRRESLAARRGFLKDAADMAKSGESNRPIWSENLKRWIPRDERTVIDTGVLNGKQVAKYSDGTYEVENPGGTYDVFGPDGKKIGTRSAGN